MLKVDKEERKDKKTKLKNAFNLPEKCIKKLMKETYAIQRSTINQGSHVNFLLEEWPYLFEVVHHLITPTPFLVSLYKRNLWRKSPKKVKTIKDFLKMKREATESTEQPLQLISCFAKYFKELSEILIIQNMVGNFLYFDIFSDLQNTHSSARLIK